jgi:hypothetical protein
MYPQGNEPDPWRQYNQQPQPQDAYQQQPTHQMPPYQVGPYQQPGGYAGQPFPGPGYQAQPSRGRTPLIIAGAVAGALLVVCALAVVLVRLGIPSDDKSGSAPIGKASASERPTATPTTPSDTDAPTEESVEGDLTRFSVGDCLTITGAENTVSPATCTDSGAYKVLLRRDATTDQAVCDSTEATQALYQDADGTSEDLVLCVVLAT